jgi:hypothetical protein
MPSLCRRDPAGMDRCEEDVIIVCGLYLLAEEEKRKKGKLWVHKVFRAREEEGEFHTLLGRLNDDRQKFYKYFRMSVSKFEALMSLHQNNNLLLVHHKRCSVSHWPLHLRLVCF